MSDRLRANVPDALQVAPAWLLWRYGKAKADGKRPKLPHYVSTGRMRRGTQGSEADLRKLATFEAAVARLEAEPDKWDGIGIAMLRHLGFVGIDVDGALTDAEMAQVFAGTYHELSPSGGGRRRGFLVGSMEKLPDNGRIGVFCEGQFLTVTGCAEEGTPRTLAMLTDDRADLLRRLHGGNVPVEDDGSEQKGFTETALAPLSHQKPMGLDLSAARALLGRLSASWCVEHDLWVMVGMALHFEYGGHDDALALWDEWSSTAPTNYDQGECARRWPTFGKDPSRRKVTMATLVYEVRRVEASSSTQRLRLHNPLHAEPPRVEYMLRAPIWLPDLPEQFVFYGRSEAFKSVVVQALCVHMAAGVALDGTKMPPRVVVYAAEEAPTLWDCNLHAWRLHFAKTLPADVRDHAVQNLHAGYLQRIDGNIGGLTKARAKEIAGLVRAEQTRLRSDARPVVVFDPVAEVMVGDETKAPDTREYVACGREVQRETGALVGHVHHTGHAETDRERGSSALPAAMFARYQVLRADADAYLLEIRCRKHKARAKPAASSWSVDIVDLMPDTDVLEDDPRTGVVVQHNGAAVASGGASTSVGEGRLRQLVAAYGEDPTIGGERLRMRLKCGDNVLGKLRSQATVRGLLQAGGGEGRAKWSITDAGREWVAATHRAVPDQDGED